MKTDHYPEVWSQIGYALLQVSLLTLKDISDRVIDNSGRFNYAENWIITVSPNIKRMQMTYFTSKKNNAKSHYKIAWWLQKVLKLKIILLSWGLVDCYNFFHISIHAIWILPSRVIARHCAFILVSWYGTVVLYSCTLVLYSCTVVLYSCTVVLYPYHVPCMILCIVHYILISREGSN